MEMKLLTTHDVCELFDVTPQTIHYWRLHEGFPTVRIKGEKKDAVRFNENDVRVWAKKTNRKLTK